MKLKFLLSLTILLISACSQATNENSKIVSDSKIVLIGDEIRNQVLADCMKTSVCVENDKLKVITPPENADAVTTGQYTNQAQEVVLIVDAKNGPLPITREHILISRQTKAPKMSVLFVDSEMIDDKELMDMEVDEIKNLIASYDMQDQLTNMYFGKQGLKQLLNDTKQVTNKDKPTFETKTTHIQAQIYNMTKEELGVPLKNSSEVLVWISGQITKAKLIATHNIAQGEIADIELEFENPVYTSLAERFFIQVDNRIVAAGVLIGMK